MAVDAETQKLFDDLMGQARKVGAMFADQLVTGAPPPWEEAWFEDVYTKAIDAAGFVFKAKHPALSETIIANMQVRYCEGFEARIRELLPHVRLNTSRARQ